RSLREPAGVSAGRTEGDAARDRRAARRLDLDRRIHCRRGRAVQHSGRTAQKRVAATARVSRGCGGVINWRRAMIGIGIALPIIALLAYGMTTDPRALPTTLPGRPAPDFALRVMGSAPSDTVRLSDQRGSIVVLNFWASWCLECRVEHADLSRVAT